MQMSTEHTLAAGPHAALLFGKSLLPADVKSTGNSSLHTLHSCSDGIAAELLALQGAKQDLELGQAILVDKLQQCKAENERLVQQIEKLKARISNSTQDYVCLDGDPAGSCLPVKPPNNTIQQHNLGLELLCCVHALG